MKCLVSGCNNKQRQKIPGISFHRFPKSKTLAQKWLMAIGLPNFNLISRDVICSLHFDEDDLKPLKKKVLLVKRAVPSLRITSDTTATVSSEIGDQHNGTSMADIDPFPKMETDDFREDESMNVDIDSSTSNSMPFVSTVTEEPSECNSQNDSSENRFPKQDVLRQKSFSGIGLPNFQPISRENDIKKKKGKIRLPPKAVPAISEHLKQPHNNSDITMTSGNENSIMDDSNSSVEDSDSENEHDRTSPDNLIRHDDNTSSIGDPLDVDESEDFETSITAQNEQDVNTSNDVEQILKDLLSGDGYDTIETREAIFDYLSTEQIERSDTPNSLNDNEEIDFENIIPTNHDNKIIKENIYLKKKILSLNKVIQSLNNDINILKYKNQNLTKNVGILHESNQIKEKELKKYKNVLSNMLTENQLDFMLKKLEKETDIDEKSSNWCLSEIVKGITLKYLGHNNYSYLQKQLNYPIPPLMTITKWINNINLKDGILQDIFHLLNLAGKLKTDKDRVTILMYGEIETKYLYEYDKISDDIVGPHKTMQIIMARGLFSYWQQPIFIGFDVNITKTLLGDIIEKLLEINYNTVAIVSNFVETNFSLWNELELSSENNYFFHRTKREKIYIFSDTIISLKLLRNSFINFGVIFENNKFLTKESLKIIFGPRSKQLVSSIDHKCSTKEEIEFAIELFSNITATKLRENTNENDAADFCDTVTNWFNIMYSRKIEYGRNIENQELIMNKMYETIKTMRHSNSDTLEVYQQAILISISSLKSLYEDMKKKYNISYILSWKLNLDPLETLFSEIKNYSTDDHPTPIDAIDKIRSIILGKHIQLDTNDSREFFITVDILKKAKLETIINELPILDESDRLPSIPNINENLIHLIAWNYKDKYPGLVKQTPLISSANSKLKSKLGPSFLAANWWLNMAEIMDYHFQTIHRPTFQRKSCTKQLINLIQKKHPEVPHELIEVFIKQRTLCMIKRLNVNITSNRSKNLKK